MPRRGRHDQAVEVVVRGERLAGVDAYAHDDGLVGVLHAVRREAQLQVHGARQRLRDRGELGHGAVARALHQPAAPAVEAPGDDRVVGPHDLVGAVVADARRGLGRVHDVAEQHDSWANDDAGAVPVTHWSVEERADRVQLVGGVARPRVVLGAVAGDEGGIGYKGGDGLAVLDRHRVAPSAMRHERGRLDRLQVA